MPGDAMARTRWRMRHQNLASTINNEINSLASMTADQKAQYLVLHPAAAALDGLSEVSSADFGQFTSRGLTNLAALNAAEGRYETI